MLGWPPNHGHGHPKVGGACSPRPRGDTPPGEPRREWLAVPQNWVKPSPAGAAPWDMICRACPGPVPIHKAASLVPDSELTGSPSPNSVSANSGEGVLFGLVSHRKPCQAPIKTITTTPTVKANRVVGDMESSPATTSGSVAFVAGPTASTSVALAAALALAWVAGVPVDAAATVREAARPSNNQCNWWRTILPGW
mmetsp:Transcript_84794/g.235099  ORF Transcript_84794/g.235099 Transcript_84794/m.235099 type:complete len:196 (-) Transcript_84794:93-680(-)